MRIVPRIASGVRAARRLAGGSFEFDLLARTFFERFFDNEVTGGTPDLRSSFFWLIAFLAAPGIFMPFLMMFNWETYALMHGTDALAIAARGDKVLYVGYAMIASGAISAITWSSLLLDRRDCLVLGTLPIPAGKIVRAKLTALCLYIVMVSLGVHALASCAYGLLLAAHGSLGWIPTGTVAHLLASCCASAFVLFSVTALQGVLLAAIGPRRFGVVSPWLQSVLVAGVLLGLVYLPIISTSTVSTLSGAATARPWILRTPPLWFLGLYEVILRNSDPTLTRLAMTALAALAGAGAITLVIYPIAYKRLMSAVAETPAPLPAKGRVGWLLDRAAALVSRDVLTRASAQFFVATLRRSMRHRLAFALAVGATTALVMPTLFRWAPRLDQLPHTPSVDLLALSFKTMTFLLIGLRIAASLPADLNAGWVIDSIGGSRGRMRAGLWRTLFGLVVLPVAMLTVIGCWIAWGASVALPHAFVCLAFGGAVVEGLLWGFEALPCSRPFRPERAALRKWWPAYLVGFVFIARVLPMLETRWANFASWPWIAGAFAIAAVMLRWSHHRHMAVFDADADEPHAVQLLNLGG